MLHKRVLTFTLVLAFLLMGVGFLPIHGEAEIYDTVVRLHVLANSDSEEDQALKLKVRDAILSLTVPLLEDCTSQEEALSRLDGAREDLLAAARGVILEAGRTDGVRIEMGLEEYPTRDYDGVCFPSGTYASVRVCIGAAEGQNWWCCLFPPLCLGAATVSSSRAEDACISVGFTPDQYKIITESDRPVYRVRFKLLELLG